jgi:hypothetical protein
VKDIVLPLRRGYYALLNGIDVDGKTVNLYDMVASYEVEAPYIIIESILPTSNNTKDGFYYVVTVDLLIYATYKGDFGGRELTDKIVNAIQQLVIPTPGKSGVSADGFHVYMAKQAGSNDEFDYSDIQRIYRKRLTIEHLVQQL